MIFFNCSIFTRLGPALATTISYYVYFSVSVCLLSLYCLLDSLWHSSVYTCFLFGFLMPALIVFFSFHFVFLLLSKICFFLLPWTIWQMEFYFPGEFKFKIRSDTFFPVCWIRDREKWRWKNGGEILSSLILFQSMHSLRSENCSVQFGFYIVFCVLYMYIK